MPDLTRKEFDVLEVLAEAGRALSQRGLEKQTGFSLATVNRTVKDLSNRGLVEDGAITEAGLEALSCKDRGRNPALRLLHGPPAAHRARARRRGAPALRSLGRCRHGRGPGPCLHGGRQHRRH